MQPMATAGVELIAGTFRDDRFGPMVMVGLGGIFVELLHDTALRLAPIDESEARRCSRACVASDSARCARQPAVDIDAIAALIATLSGFAWAHPEIKEMDLNPIVAYEDGLAMLDARISSSPIKRAHLSRPASCGALRKSERAFEPRAVVVIGDKRMGGYMWLRAMKHFTGKLYSVQIDPNEIPGIEAMGIENRKSLAEITEHIDYAVSAVPRQVAPRILKDCVDNKSARSDFSPRDFPRRPKSWASSSKPICARPRSHRISRWSVRIAWGLQSGAGCAIFPTSTWARPATYASSRRAAPTPSTFACRRRPRHQGEQGRIDRQRPDAGSGGLYRSDGRGSDDARARDVYRGHARRAALLRERQTRGREASGGDLEGRRDRGGRACDFLAYWIVRDAGRSGVRWCGRVARSHCRHSTRCSMRSSWSRAANLKGRGMGLVAMTGGQSVGITDTFATAGLEFRLCRSRLTRS